jgi:hypothetical protein
VLAEVVGCCPEPVSTVISMSSRGLKSAIVLQAGADDSSKADDAQSQFLLRMRALTMPFDEAMDQAMPTNLTCSLLRGSADSPLLPGEVRFLPSPKRKVGSTRLGASCVVMEYTPWQVEVSAGATIVAPAEEYMCGYAAWCTASAHRISFSSEFERRNCRSAVPPQGHSIVALGKPMACLARPLFCGGYPDVEWCTMLWLFRSFRIS